MVTIPPSHPRHVLGDFIRSMRERLTPEIVGLPAGTRRRTPGLRREEVAQLSGLSTTWYTWIEQGREVSVSPGALARLADILRLDRAERAYLFALAGKVDPAVSRGRDRGDVPGAVLASVETIVAPAYILDRTWTAVAWNTAAARLFVGWLDDPGADRNLLRYIFLRPEARRLIVDWERRARRVAAEFRAAVASRLDEPDLDALVGSLRRDSPPFAAFWDRHGVLSREGGLRTFDHPRDGPLRFEQVTFDLASRPDLKLNILVADG